MRDKKRKEKFLKELEEEEERKRNIEYIRMQEWEEKFDQQKKLEEQEELRREKRLKERELSKYKPDESENLEISSSTSLENFEIDKSSQN